MKLEHINEQIAKTKERISEQQMKLKGLEAQRTELENLQIVRAVKAMKMTPAELNAFLSAYASGELTLPGQSDTEGGSDSLAEQPDAFEENYGVQEAYRYEE